MDTGAFAVEKLVWWPVQMFRMAAGTLVVMLVCVGCTSKPSSQASPVPQVEADRKNPTELSTGSIQQGRDLYHSADCALCHGKEGDGRGVLAKDTRLSVHDWRKTEYNKSFTDGQLYYLIVKGKGMMPSYETRNTPDQIWLMVDYIRSMTSN